MVVWDREDYLKEAGSQLGDYNVYEKVVNPLPTLNKAIKSCISEIKKRRDISLETQAYFMINNPRLGRFYMLPKIHKRLFNVPGRPVVSNTNYHTENISPFLDYHLQPLAQKVKSYVKDTNDFLRKIRDLKKVPENAILCTIDVVGLYPSIPHEEGLATLKNALDARREKTVSTDSLMDLASLVLKNNFFEFNEEFYLQKQGTAIGTKMAPSYAILFMDALESAFLDSVAQKPLIWWRYIDDIFLVWEHGESALRDFIAELNAFHPSVKFTSEWSYNCINYLDVSVSKKEDGTLLTDLYTKPTDTHQYLHWTSCHPFYCKKLIPHSQALRLGRICSERGKFDERCKDLENWLCERGYNRAMVKDQILSARRFSRKELLNKAKGSKPYRVSLNITYHPVLRDTRKVLENIHLLLAPDGKHREVFEEIPMVGFRNAKSLKDFLVRAKLPKENVTLGCFKCKKCNCQICNILEESATFTDRAQSRVYDIRQGPLNCNSMNIVYLIQCNVCGKQNCGSTITKCRTRINNYKSKFRSYRDKFLTGTLPEGQIIQQANFHDHFCQAGHNGISDWSLKIIDQAEDETSLRRKESFWQHKLDTFAPNGLNEREVPTL